MAEIQSLNEAEVQGVVGNIRTINKDMMSILDNIAQQIKALKDKGMQNEAGDALAGSIPPLQSKISEYNSIIETYAKFLEDVVNETVLTENTAKSNAEQFATI